jgi:hypothetical protein
MKTAMQELIDSYHLIDKFTDFDTWIANNEKRLLEKEKQQTIDFSIGAYQDISRMKGVSENLISENKILFEEYYNQTYNQNK